MKGNFVLVGGDVLKVLVGQAGAPPVGSGTNQYGGGGGTFITDINNNPMIVAGGGGGSWAPTYTAITDAPTTTAGNTGGGTGSTGGTGGTAGLGGGTATSGDGGGGLLGDGAGNAGGFAFINGGAGGIATASGGEGGFGGGGGASSFNNRRGGGGGGYSGGGGAHGGTTGFPEAGGGGSFNSGASPVNIAGSNIDDGAVIIRPLSSGALNDIGIAGVTPGSVECSGEYDIEVTVLNFGINQVSTSQLNWEWNGALQTPVSITTVLDTFGGSGSSSTVINLGTQNLVGSNTLKVWTSNPNNSADTVNINDTLELTLSPQFTSAEIFSVTNGEVCGAGPVTLSATFGGDVLNWFDDPGLTNLVNTGSTYTLTVSQTDTFYLRAENTGNSCDSDVEIAIAEVNFTPTVNFTSIANNCVVDFTGLVSTNTDSVRWDFGDGGTSTQLNPQYTYSATQSYLVNLIAYDGTCFKDTTKALFVNCQVSLENPWAQSVSMYPNPSKGQVSVIIPDAKNTVLISVLDIKGQTVIQQGIWSFRTF